jgi:hypothetical protein
MPNKGFTVELRRGYKCLVRCCNGGYVMSIGLILVIILVIFLLGGISGRFGGYGYGYGYGHGGIGVIGVVLIILVVLLLMGRL